MATGTAWANSPAAQTAAWGDGSGTYLGDVLCSSDCSSFQEAVIWGRHAEPDSSTRPEGWTSASSSKVLLLVPQTPGCLIKGRRNALQGDLHQQLTSTCSSDCSSFQNAVIWGCVQARRSCCSWLATRLPSFSCFLAARWRWPAGTECRGEQSMQCMLAQSELSRRAGQARLALICRQTLQGGQRVQCMPSRKELSRHAALQCTAHNSSTSRL